MGWITQEEWDADTSGTGIREACKVVVSVSKTSTSPVNSEMSGKFVSLKVDQLTTVTEYRGLTEELAKNLAKSTSFNFTSRCALYLKWAIPGGSAWYTWPNITGAQSNAVARRANEAQGWILSVTDVETVTPSGATPNWADLNIKVDGVSVTSIWNGQGTEPELPYARFLGI